MSPEPLKDLFLTTLWEIFTEQSATLKTQFPRLRDMWEQHWQSLGVVLPKLRLLPLDRAKYFAKPTNLAYHLECVNTLKNAMSECFLVIKAIVDTLFNVYLTSDLLSQDFEQDDKIPVSFLISEILVGSLLQFITLDKTPIPLGFVLIAKNKSLLRLRGRSLTQLHEDLLKNDYTTNLDEVEEIMEDMINLGYISEELDEKTSEVRYKFIHEFTLSEKGHVTFQKTVRPLLDWAVEMWRSLFNIRGLDIIIPSNYPLRDFLSETVKRAATQGYVNAYNVMENIGNFYQMCIDQKMRIP